MFFSLLLAFIENEFGIRPTGGFSLQLALPVEKKTEEKKCHYQVDEKESQIYGWWLRLDRFITDIHRATLTQ